MRSFHQLHKPTLRVLAASALVAAILAPARLHATPITYNLTLTPDAGSLYGGTGSLTIDAAPSLSGVSGYVVGDGTLKDLTFTIDNRTFTLGNASGDTFARFLDGQLHDISFTEAIGGRPNRVTLDTSDDYAFYYDNDRSASYGSFAASMQQTSSPVSEPASLALFGIGLFLGIGLLYRTHSPRFASKAHLPEAR